MVLVSSVRTAVPELAIAPNIRLDSIGFTYPRLALREIWAGDKVPARVVTFNVETRQFE